MHDSPRQSGIDRRGSTVTRIRCAATSIAACATILVVGASAATAKTVTMHFFSKSVYSRISDASGRPLPPSSSPAVGDRFSFASDDYRGDHRHHAKLASASDHVVCELISTTRGLCNGTIALGGAMILSDDFVLDFNSKTVRARITGGTGRYQRAHGTVIAKSVGHNSDVTIKVSS
jgi:hypothetical protein